MQPQPMQQGYHFPPADPEPAYGYGGQQLMPAQQQWGQPQPDPRAYELAYQTYAPTADPGPSPFQASAAHAQQQGYGGEMEPEYGDDYYEDEEPRRGKRWLLITVALVGAIGVGGALAYGYRSFIAGHPGRVPVVKADANVKAKPDFRGGKDFAGTERRPPVRISEDGAPQREAEPAAEPDDEAPAAPPPLKRSIAVPPPPTAPRAPTARTASTGLGYVAVLFTEKTSMDALKKFADMQQKYTDVLVDKTPDVQEADLSDRGLGTQYRLVVGPPGSRNAASGVCAQLKSAGYSGCWVKEY
jgi:hypothetical protein